MTTCQLFTAKDANKTLPLVKKIVADILATGTDIRDRSERCGDGFENNPEYKRLFAELRELLAELEAIGCVYKDFNFSVGLVDFPGMIDDEEGHTSRMIIHDNFILKLVLIYFISLIVIMTSFS